MTYRAVFDDWRMNQFDSALSETLDDAEGVLTSAAALRYLSEDQLRWKISSGRWQKPVRGVVHLLAPYGYRRRNAPLGLTVITHYSRRLTDEDVHPAKQPRRTRIARSIIDVASWMATDRGAMAVLAAGVQQRLVRVEDARQVAEYRLAVEIDGAQHTEDPRQRWDDMERDIDLGADGYGTLRFPAWLVRQDPAYIARRIQESLRRAGYRA